MRFPANLIDLLIDHDAFRVCRIMPEREFIRFCKERGIDVDPARLSVNGSNELFKTLENWASCLIDASLGPRPV